MHHCQKTSVRAINLAAGIALALLLAGCLPRGWQPRQTRPCRPPGARAPACRRRSAIPASSSRPSRRSNRRSAGWPDGDRRRLSTGRLSRRGRSEHLRTPLPRGVRPNCRDYYAAGEISAETAGLRWRECPVQPDIEEWRQAEACFGHPALAWDDADRAAAGERTAAGWRLTIGADVYETREIATPIPNLSLYTLSANSHLQRLFRAASRPTRPTSGWRTWRAARPGRSTTARGDRHVRRR